MAKKQKLPARMYWKHGAYYHQAPRPSRKWTCLGADYTKALRLHAELEAEHLVAAAGTVGAMLKRYEQEQVPKLAEKTQIDYRRYIQKLHAIFGVARLDQIKPHHIAKYLDTHPHPTTANREIATLSTAFNHAKRWGMTDTNPCQGISRNKEKARERYLEDWELQALMIASGPQLRAIIEVGYLTALRKSDLLRLTLADIDGDVLHARVGKTNKRIRIGISPALHNALERAKRAPRDVRSTTLLANSHGQPYTVTGFDSVWKAVVRRSGLEDVHFHDIRAKALTDVTREKGRDAAQALAAHSIGETTETYVRARDKVIVAPTR